MYETNLEIREKLTKHHIKRMKAYFRNAGRPHLGITGDNIDIDLAGLGLVDRVHSLRATVYEITPLGERILYELKEENVVARQPHHDLASRVAEWLQTEKRVTWENISFDIRDAKDEYIVTTVRPDVFSVAPTLAEKRIVPMIHEVKVSRSDLLSDISKPEKREGYFLLADYVHYVVPEGICDISDIPPECGLIVETSPGKFKVLKKGKKNKNRKALKTRQWMAIILRTAVEAGKIEGL